MPAKEQVWKVRERATFERFLYVAAPSATAAKRAAKAGDWIDMTEIAPVSAYTYPGAVEMCDGWFSEIGVSVETGET